jgi:hypothetical protein
MSKPNDRAFDLGYERGNATGRRVPNDHDYEWLAYITDGEIQGDPDDILSFDEGMDQGARAK